ncbi:MAG: hypothetical protein AAB267_05795, partial [Candidatus Desantisbacteria bacterium]
AGATGQIDTSVNTLSSAIASNGGIYLANDKGLVVSLGSATNGSIVLTTQGNTTLTSLSATGTVTNNIDVTVNSDLTVGSLSADDTITLTANTGSINGNGLTNPNIVASALYLDAAQDIGKDIGGTDNTLYTEVDELYAYAGGDIGIIDEGLFDAGILNDGDLDLVEVEADSVAIEVASDINVGSVTAVEAVGLVADGSILALLDDLGNNLSDIEASVLYLDAGLDIGKDETVSDEDYNPALDEDLDEDPLLLNYTLYTQVDELYAYAGGDIGIIDEGLFDAGILNTRNLALVEVEANRVAIQAASNLTLGSIVAEEGVGLVASGSIQGDEEISPNITTALLYLDAGENIGNLTTDIDSLYAYAGGSIDIYDIDSLTLNDVEAGSLDSINITSADDLYVGYVQDGYWVDDNFIGGTVNLTSNNGSIIGLANEGPNIRTANLTLNANDGSIYGYNISGELITDIDNLYAYAGYDINLYDVASLSLQDVQAGSLEEVPGSISITSQYDMYVGYVQDGYYDEYDNFIGGNVNLTSNNGDIIGLDQGLDEDGNPNPNIVTSYLTLVASGSIYGAYNNPPAPGYLVTQIDTLDAQAGDLIKVYDIDSLTLNDVEAGSLDSINITSADDLYVGY